MTPDQEPFIRAIQENPDDEAPLLIFGDWLEENGQLERAEHVRLSCELKRSAVEFIGGAGPASWEIERKLRELDCKYESLWLRELPRIDGLYWHAIEDGVVRTARLYVHSAKQADAILAVLFRTMPVRCLEFWELSDAAARRFARHADLKFVRTIDFRGPRVQAGAARILLRSSHLTGLRELAGSLCDVLYAEDLPHVETLRMYRGGHRVVDFPMLGQLKTLELDTTDINLDWPRDFVNSRYSPDHLGELILRSCSLYTTGFATIVQSERLANLRSLTLSNCRIGLQFSSREGDENSNAYEAMNYGGAPLASLNEIDPQGDWPGLRNLVALDLSHNPWLEVQAPHWLASCSGLRNLRALNVRGCGLGRGVLSLADSSHLRSDLMLKVDRGDISGDDAALLRKSFPNTRFFP